MDQSQRVLQHTCLSVLGSSKSPAYSCNLGVSYADTLSCWLYTLSIPASCLQRLLAGLNRARQNQYDPNFPLGSAGGSPEGIWPEIAPYAAADYPYCSTPRLVLGPDGQQLALARKLKHQVSREAQVQHVYPWLVQDTVCLMRFKHVAVVQQGGHACLVTESASGTLWLKHGLHLLLLPDAMNIRKCLHGSSITGPALLLLALCVLSQDPSHPHADMTDGKLATEIELSFSAESAAPKMTMLHSPAVLLLWVFYALSVQLNQCWTAVSKVASAS